MNISLKFIATAFKIPPKRLHKMDKMGMEFLVLWMYFILRNILCLNKFMSLLRCSHSAQKNLYYLFHLTKSSIFFKSISIIFSVSDEILYSLT